MLRVATMALTVVKISILARLLSPEDFGLFSLVVIALGIAEASTQTGVNVTIIQSKQSIKYFLNSAWVIAISRGFIIGIAMVLLSLVMQRYYNEPQLPLLISITALVPIIKGFINPAIVTMRKELRFFRDAVYYFSLAIVEVAAAIAFGILLNSVWALIIALLIAAIFEVAISFIFFSPRPRFEYIASRGKVILGNARGLTASAALSYLHENIDDFILGKVVGTYNLGLYHNGYALAHKSNYEPAKAVVHSTFPVYSKIAGDANRLKRGFLRSLAATGVLVSLTSLPLLIAPDFFVHLLLGDQWSGVIPIIRWLVLAGIIQSITVVIYNLFLTKATYQWLNLHQLCSVMLLIGLLFVLPQQFGILGGAWAVLLSRVLSLPLLALGTIQVLKS